MSLSLSLSPSPSRRQRCERCQRPASHCLCAFIPSLANRFRVLVLQHPEEARHPLNTARLAVLGLQNAELWVGETFADLAAVLKKAAGAWLLFPEEKGVVPGQGSAPGAGANPGAGASLVVSGAVAAGAGAPSGPCAESSVLIVPDGTWRQARRLVQANPVLLGLPRLSLPAGTGSQYRVRRAREPAALATIEAIVQALEQLEPEQSFQALLQPFHQMVEQQIAAMGEDTYRRNHAKVYP